jgi:hypothetical protein
VFGAQSSNSLEKLDRMNDHSAGALQQWFHDHSGNLASPFFQQPTQNLNAVNGAGCTSFAHRASVAVGGMDAMHRKPEIRKGIRKSGVRTNRHRADRVPVIRVTGEPPDITISKLKDFLSKGNR